MSLKGQVDTLVADRVKVAFRQSQTYNLAGSPFTIFTIANGPIELLTLGARRSGASVAATTLDVFVDGIGADAAPVVCGGAALGDVIFIPLNVAGVILTAPALPKTVATLTTMLAGTNVGIITVAVGGVAGSMVLEWFLVFRPLSPNAIVI